MGIRDDGFPTSLRLEGSSVGRIVNVSKHLLCVRHCAKHFIKISFIFRTTLYGSYCFSLDFAAKEADSKRQS